MNGKKEVIKEEIAINGSSGSSRLKNNISTAAVSKSLGKNKSNRNGRPKLFDSSEVINNNSYSEKELLRVLTAVKNGDFSVRMPIDDVGVTGKICDALNEIISLNEKMMEEFTRAGNTIGKQGKLTQRIEIPSSNGAWRTGVNSLNSLISDLVYPTIEIAHVISSVAKGNLSQQMPLEIGGHNLQGEFARIAKEVNDMVKQLNLFSMKLHVLHVKLVQKENSADKQK